jgi:hypothetical protein
MIRGQVSRNIPLSGDNLAVNVVSSFFKGGWLYGAGED